MCVMRAGPATNWASAALSERREPSKEELIAQNAAHCPSDRCPDDKPDDLGIIAGVTPLALNHCTKKSSSKEPTNTANNGTKNLSCG